MWNRLSSWLASNDEQSELRTLRSDVPHAASKDRSEREYRRYRLENMAELPEESHAYIRELFDIVAGEDDTVGDDTFVENSPGYERSADQRRADCLRVQAILASGAPGVHANLTWTYGQTLLWLAAEYDHRHDAEMIRALIEAGADANAPNAVDGLRPLQSPWLDDCEMEGDHLALLCNGRKREYLLQQGGADESLLRRGDCDDATARAMMRKRPRSAQW
jgi:ankyrin repeat protein